MRSTLLVKNSVLTLDIGVPLYLSDVNEQLGVGVDISEKIKPHDWEKLPWRWEVERTLAWLNRSRRLSKDDEILISSAEALLKSLMPIRCSNVCEYGFSVC